MKNKALIGALIGVALTPIAIAVTLKSASHGDLYWAGVFFPLLTIFLLKGAGPLIIPLVLVQYPFFGWYTGRCISRVHYLRVSVVLLGLQVIPMLLAMFT